MLNLRLFGQSKLLNTAHTASDTEYGTNCCKQMQTFNTVIYTGLSRFEIEGTTFIGAVFNLSVEHSLLTYLVHFLFIYLQCIHIYTH